MERRITNIEQFCILPTDTIKHALKQISETGKKCILVTNDKNKFLGTLSDGDLRRAILNNQKLNSQIKSFYNKKSFVLIKNKYSDLNLKKIFLKKKVDLIPVINNKKKIINVISLTDILENKETQKKIDNIIPVIMAGGKGTRLKPFTNILPKPLLPVNGKTAIETIIDNLKIYGLNKFLISINEKSEIIKGFFHGIKKDYEVKFIEEKKPLGTIGSLNLIKSKDLKDNLLVINCDVIFQLDIRDLYDFHKKNNFDITIVVSDKRFQIPYGVCEISKKGNLKKINEKPSYDYLVNIGLYLLKKKVIKLIPKNKLLDFNQIVEFSQKKKFKIGVFPISESGWQDTGHWSDFNKLNL